MKLSVVSSAAQIGQDVRIHDFANIYGACAIGSGSVIGAFVEIQPGAVIGKGVKVSSHTFICDGVTIDDEAFIGHGVMFTNDRFPRSVFDDGTPVTAATTHVVPTRICRRAAIGSGSTILCGITIGEGALVGAGSVVTKDVPPHAVVAGNPARVVNTSSFPETRSAMPMPEGLQQPHNQILFDEYKEHGPVQLGPYSSYTWRHDPRHLLFTLARYKFCAKLLQGCESVLEIGCGDAVGSPMLLQAVKRLHGVDLEPAIIADDIRRNEYGDRLSFEAVDLTKASPAGTYDAAVSLDVIEHIAAEEEDAFLRNIVARLNPNATCIIGTPNVTSQQYASENSRAGHINLKDHGLLTASLQKYFHNVFVFSMNDEVVHTGYEPMAHYLMGVATGKR